MILIPQNRKWSQSNVSDLISPIDSSFNINLDKFGYVQLSNRSVAIKREADEANFGLSMAAHRYSTADYRIVTEDEPYILTFNTSSGLTVTEDTDTDNPATVIYSDGVHWQARWHVTGTNSLTYKVAGTWTVVTLSPALTASKFHPMCVFESRNQLMIGNGNQVKQVDTSYVDTVNLTLPADYEAIRIAYGNGRAAILATNVSDTAATARLFIWDGTSAGANSLIDVDAGRGIDVVFFLPLSTFVVMNSNGQLSKYNGSTLTEIARLPIFESMAQWADTNNNRVNLGRSMAVDRDNIYINVSSDVNDYGNRAQSYLEKMPGGVWCYNTDAGLYHKSASGNSLSFSRNVTTANVDIATNIITVSATVPPTGTPVKYVGSSPIGGLINAKTYYTIYVSSTTFKLATTKTNALAGTAIDLTSAGGNDFQHVTFFPEYDFGQAWGSDTGLVVPFNYDSTSVYNGFLTAQNLRTSTSSTDTLSLSVMDIENRGYFTTLVITTSVIMDAFSRLFIKHKPLQYDVDKIVIKYKIKDFDPIISPNNINGSNRTITWTNATTFTTTDPGFSSAETGDEIEILAGYGSGQRAHISSVVDNSGTYTVVLDETILGPENTYVSYVMLDKWKKLATISTSSNSNVNGYSEVLLPNTKARQIKFKIELRGIGVTVEELQVINTNYKQSV